jgi:TetR/AcrR family transcriptional regulator
MTEKENNTEKLILDAAKNVFLRKGLDGARMQEIADEAGINKALLHYYFRSKDKLFETIFQEAFKQFLPRVSDLIVSDKPIFEKIWGFVETYIDMLMANPHVPIFILSELNHNPDRLINIFQGFGIQPQFFAAQIQKEIDAGVIRPVNPRHLIVNMLAMCVFPFVGRPIIKGILFQNDDVQYQVFLQERKTEITLFIINALKVE